MKKKILLIYYLNTYIELKYTFYSEYFNHGMSNLTLQHMLP